MHVNLFKQIKKEGIILVDHKQKEKEIEKAKYIMTEKAICRVSYKVSKSLNGNVSANGIGVYGNSTTSTVGIYSSVAYKPTSKVRTFIREF